MLVVRVAVCPSTTNSHEVTSVCVIVTGVSESNTIVSAQPMLVVAPPSNVSSPWPAPKW